MPRERAQVRVTAGLVWYPEVNCRLSTRLDDVGITDHRIGLRHILLEISVRRTDQPVGKVPYPIESIGLDQCPVVRNHIGIDELQFEDLPRLGLQSLDGELQVVHRLNLYLSGSVELLLPWIGHPFGQPIEILQHRMGQLFGDRIASY